MQEQHAAALLKKAEEFARFFIKSPFFLKTMPSGYEVRFDWPGVLSVAMPTGEIIIQSEPGKPTRERADEAMQEQHAAALLKKAEEFARFFIKSPFFLKTMPSGHEVRFDWPGVLSVALPTGEIIIQSEPGKPTTPKATDAA